MEGDLQLGTFLKTMKSSLLFPSYLSCFFHCMQVKGEDKPLLKIQALSLWTGLIGLLICRWKRFTSLNMVHIISCGLLSGVSATYLSMTPMLMFLNVSTRAPLASASVFVGAFVVNLFVGISTGILTE